MDLKLISPRDVAKVSADAGVDTVALKNGRTRQLCFGKNGEEIYLSSYRVKANAAFAAGFLARVMHGFDLETITKLADATGACVVIEVGVEAGFASLDETMDFIQKQETGSKK